MTSSSPNARVVFAGGTTRLKSDGSTCSQAVHPRPHSPEPEVGVGAALGLEAQAGPPPSQLCCAFTGSAARKTSECPVTHIEAQGESLTTPMGPAGTRLAAALQHHPPAAWARPWAGQSGAPATRDPTQGHGAS